MKLWLVAEQHDGTVHRVALELATLAQGFLDRGMKVQAFSFGKGSEAVAERLSEYGITEILLCPDERFDRFGAGAWAWQLAHHARENIPSLILIGATPFGREVAGLLGAWLDGSLLGNITDLRREGDHWVATEHPFAGTWETTVTATKEPVVATWKPQSLTPQKCIISDPQVQTVASSLDDLPPLAEVIERRQTGRKQQVTLTEAEIIVSGGRGVGGPEGFKPLRELCEVLGAALGASRAAVDSGWIPYEHQVGQTGKTVKPRIYIACGISGAIQHRAGMQTSDVIIAINKDSNAPIFQICDLGVVGDLFEIIPKLTEEIRRRKQKR